MTERCTGSGERGCACPYHAAKRRYQREHKRAVRERALAEARRHAQRCPRKLGAAVCDGLLETSIGKLGETIVTCPRCERQRSGICLECPRPVVGQVGKARYCAEHRQAARRASQRASEAEHREERLARQRAHYQNDDQVRERRNEYKRRWRKAHPEKVRAQKKRYVERHRDDPSSAYLRYQVRYRRKHHAYYAELQRRRDALKPRRTSPRCTHCGRPTRWTPIPGVPTKPWSKCARCCWPHELKRRRAVRRAALKKAEALAQRPAKLRPPKAPAVRGPGFERLCITPGCEIVVTGRKKKCTKCRARDRQHALEALAPTRGRGHRTDLERVA